MTARTPPFVIQASSHPAEHFREMAHVVAGSPFGAFAGGVSAFDPGHGIGHTLDLAVTQNGTPAMNVLVAGGGCQIRGTENQNQGVYTGYNDASTLLTIAAADATNPRRDLVVAKVRDAAYSGASNDFSLAVVTGTPAGSPVDPAVPNNAFVIARVAVAALASSIVNANITDLRTKSRGSAWNLPWGVVAYAEPNSSNQGSITTAVDLTGLTVTVNLLANRYYRFTGFGHFTSTVTGDHAKLAVLLDGSVVSQSYAVVDNVDTVSTTASKGRTTTTTASHTIKLQGSRDTGSGTLTFYTSLNAYVMVEDLGPV